VTVNAVYHRAYLPNAVDGTLTIINTDTDAVTKTVTVGTTPQDTIVARTAATSMSSTRQQLGVDSRRRNRDGGR
jgi:YVTN family beta-propeller protein